MNDRILELAEQAGDYYRFCKPGAYAYPNPVVECAIPKEYIEKFAELIIKECSSILSDIDKAQTKIGEYVNPADLLKTYFGIKR